MPTAPALVPRTPSADHLEPERLLAVGAFGVLAIELVATLLGQRGTVGGVVAFGVMVGFFVGAAALRRRGCNRESALLAAGTLLVAIPVLLALYPQRYGMALLGPLAFVIALPHLGGRALLGFSLLAGLMTAAALAFHFAPSTSVGAPVAAINVIAASYGVIVLPALLFMFIWRAHRTARATDVRFRKLVEDLPVGIVRTSPDGTFLEVNPTYARMLGYAPADLIGIRVSTLFDDPSHRDAFRQSIEADGTSEGEVRLRRADGAPVWAWFRSRVERDRAGSVRWFDTVIDDVTAEREHRESRNLLAAIVDTASDAIFAQSLDGRALTWNAGAERMYGWTAAEFVGRSVFDLIDEDDAAAHRSLLERVRGGETIGPIDVRRRARDGSTLVVSLLMTPARDADGRVVTVATIARDVTDQHRLRLEQASLEAQLRQAHKLEAVGRLAGGVAHDFNNLLTTIQGYGQLVAADLTDRALEDQQQVLGAASRAAELVRRLLQFSREAPLDPRAVHVDEAIRDGVAMIERLVPEHVTLEVALDAPVHVLVDRVELEQALLSLVANALEAMPSGGRLTIASTRLPAEGTASTLEHGMGAGPHVRIAVSDTGVGMDEATRVRAFEPFFTTKGVGEGSGLGLSSVYGLAQRANGRVDLRTTLGAGTTISLVLPVTAADDVERALPARRYVPVGNERILLVEDDASVRDLTARILRRAHYEVLEAASPVEALAIAASEPFDALVTDVIMPGMTGADLAARQRPGLPIVFMSGYPGDAMPALQLDLPTRRFIEKPFQPVALVAMLRDVLDAAAMDPAAAMADEQPVPVE